VKSVILPLAICFMTVSSAFGTPQFDKTVWGQQVLLLQSTRADVEKVLGKPSSGQGYLVSYKLNDGMLDLEYYPFDRCKPSDGVTSYFNVPEWTVTEIVFRPDRQPTIASLHLKLNQLRKAQLNPDLPQLVSYVDEKKGIEYTVASDGRLNNVRYFPGSPFDGFRCPK
jgi:hypothetical protein